MADLERKCEFCWEKGEKGGDVGVGVGSSQIREILGRSDSGQPTFSLVDLAEVRRGMACYPLVTSL